MVRNDRGVTSMSLPGGLATLFTALDKEWLSGIRSQVAGAAAAAAGGAGPSGLQQRQRSTQTMSLKAAADAGVWQIVKGFLSGGSEAELQAAAPVWMVAHAMAGISPSLAGAAAALVDARGVRSSPRWAGSLDFTIHALHTTYRAPKGVQRPLSSVLGPGGPTSKRRAPGSPTNRRPDLEQGPSHAPA